MKLSTKIILPIILISALLILLTGCFGVPDDSPGYTPGSIAGRIMIPSQCADCLTDGPCLPPKGISDNVPSHWVFAEEAIVTVIPHATLTDEDGYYTLTDVEPGVYYVITATYKNLVLKDVVEPNGVKAGETYDAGTANCESTALGLYVEYLWDMGMDVDEIELLVETYIETDKFAELVNTVCCIIEDCDNITNYCCLVECDEPEFTCSTTSLNMSIPTPACDETCTTISKPITVIFVGKDDVVINDFSDSRLIWDIPSGINFTESTGEVCLTGTVVGTYNIKVTYVDPLPDLCGSVSKTVPVTFSDCSCPLPTDVSAGGPYSATVACPDTEATIDFVGSATGTGALIYDWDFGDGTIVLDAGSTPSHTYVGLTVAASYTVTLTVNDDCGFVEATTTVTIDYVPCEPVTYTLTMAVDPIGGGTTNPAVGSHTYPENEVVTLTATPASGYHFVEWTGDASGTNPTTSVTMDGDKSVTANFEEDEPGTYTLTMAVDPIGGGTTNPAVGSHTYPENEVVTLTATPASGYHFVEWTGDASGTNPTTSVTMDADKTVTANFARENIITSINIAGWENAGCNPNFEHPHDPYSYTASDPSGITGTIALPWLTVTNPNLKSVHFFANVDAGDVVEYRYTRDMNGTDFTDWIILGGGYVSSECIEIPGAIESPPIYPTNFYIEIKVNGFETCTIWIY